MKSLATLLSSFLIPCVLFQFACNSEKSGSTTQEPIDRFELVNRHNVELHEIEPMSAMTVGNGDFAYTTDVTGMQSLEDFYYQNGIPLETRVTWAWHTFPNTENLKLEDAMKESDFHGRPVSYASIQNSPAGDYFRTNPHPIPMGQISLMTGNNEPLTPEMIQDINQHLNLWTGKITSHYEIEGIPVSVETISHPELSLVAFKIKSDLLKTGRLKPAFRFPYSYDFSKKNKPKFDWDKPDHHQTELIEKEANKVIVNRTVDTSQYVVTIRWQGEATWEEDAQHQFSLVTNGTDSLLLICEFSSTSKKEDAPTFEDTQKASAKSWKNYWTKGGAVDLSESTDPRAMELERRIVLSQYLMKVNYSGSFPPQETGLANLSWYGKHNSEVYWIHAAQFYQWNHTELLEKGLHWYQQILPAAMADAKSKGFEGARWPKMSGIKGRVSPGGINPFIIWNQPNPIYLCELVYRAKPNAQILEKYKDMVFESANFLASYAWYDAKTNRYILGPPLKSVNESTKENNTMNPTFELAQWYYGLKVAQDWRERLKMERDSLWDDILDKLARPTIQDGKYVELESDPFMYNKKGNYSSAMLMALGYLPKTPIIDEQIMRNTFETIFERNGIGSFVSWSQGKGALTAARLGDKKKAIDIVCNDVPKATFYETGYVPRPKEGIKNPAYLPVNSSFLAAIGLMASGWDGVPEDEYAPGFPNDGTWNVKVENMQRLP